MKSLMFKRKKRASKKVLMTKNDLKLLGRSSDLRKISRAKKKKELHDLKTIEHEFLLRIETFI